MFSGDMMKQAKKMQENLANAQNEIANLEVTGESGAGLVSVVMTGKHDVKKVTVDDSVLSEEKELLEDLLAAAVNDAVRKVESATQAKMAKVTGGLGLPPGMKLPF